MVDILFENVNKPNEAKQQTRQLNIICMVEELMLKCYFSLDFLRKVYTILSLQIIITTAVSALFMLCNPVKNFVHER